jgi:MoxR-like ATPase
MAITMNTVSVDGLRESIHMSVALDLPLLVEGKPGIGKSEIVRSVAEAAGYALLDRRASQMLPEDLGGIPVGDVATRTAVRCQPDLVAEATRLHESAGKPVMLFLDEVNLASRGVLSALYEVILDRRCGGFPFPPGTRVIAACNPPGSGAMVEELPRPLTNRMAVVSFSGPTFDEWTDYAFANDVSPEIIAALRVSQEFLHAKFDPEQPRSPTPRAWKRASDVLKFASSPAMRMVMLAAVVGDEAAARVAHVLDCMSKLHPSEKLLAGPDGFGAHDNLAMALLQAFALASTAKNAAQVRNGFRWVERHHPEVSGLFVKRLMARVKTEPNGSALIADAELLRHIHNNGDFVSAGNFLRKE